jgi:hypothetical protein|tara:strand:+ start:111 stop:746 length:636 start_codon:yes stop_codon:yes gene_type:complete
MQPYFIPYAGYFRLFAACDLFVIYDDVQFPKEGWVHRNRLLNKNNEPTWLTLPIQRKPLATRINEIEFLDDANKVWQEQLRKFPIMDIDSQNNPLKELIRNPGNKPLDFIVKGLETVAKILDIPFNVKYSSDLNIGNNLKGQERVLEIVKYFGANEYINAPGGTGLYDAGIFQKNGIELRFLPDYKGSKASILQRLLTEDLKEIREEIYDF